MDNETGGAYIENFRRFLEDHIQAGKESIEDFYETLETGSETAEAISKYTSPPQYTGIAYWIDSQLDGWRSSYGDGVVGEAIKEIENGFPELSDPHFYYWTKNEDVQEDIANLYNRIEAALSEAVKRIQDVLDRKKAEAEERDAFEAEQRTNRERARSQAEKALEIAEKFATESPTATPQKSGLSSLVKFVGKSIANSIKSIFRRGK